MAMPLRIGACLATAIPLALECAGVARAATCDPLTTKPKFDQPVRTAKDIHLLRPRPFSRGYTEGTKRLIWNAIAQPDP
jgi:hypothetical protein